MTTDAFVAATYLKAQGEVSTLTSSDDDYLKIVGIGNVKIDAWAVEDDWDSLYDPAVNIGTVSATDTFDLDSSIRGISNQPDDWVEITHVDGVTITRYTTVPAKELKRYNSGNFCAKVGSTLRFSKAFVATDAEFGGSITVPAYLYADHLSASKPNGVVPVDDPNWLVVISAAEFVRNDVTLSSNYPGLVAEANSLMASMKRANGAQLNTVTLGYVARSTEW